MRRDLRLIVAVGFAVLTARLACPEDIQWIAAAAHTPGVHQTLWRTDLSVHNPCDEEATIELRLHLVDNEYLETFVVASGAQQIFEDVVAQLTNHDVSGALEIRSDLPIIVTSRTYTVAAEGSHGQGFAPVVPASGFEDGQTVLVPSLREDELFRSNILILNTGVDDATVTVALFDTIGTELGNFSIDIPSGRTVQMNQPYFNRFSRDDLIGGFAELTAVSGNGLFAYGSVVDNGTGDPTTVPAQMIPDCPVDILDALLAIPGMEVHEIDSPVADARFFELYFQQAADHWDPSAGSFSQYLTLLHRSTEAPMVFRTLGYTNSLYLWNSQLTQVLDANQLFIEHRFFDDSRPSPPDWSLLTIEQAAADHHRLAEVFHQIYTGPWVSTGHSKGGMAAVYHRKFYPDDVDATVAFVAPLTLGAPDERYLETLDELGAPECRDGLREVQHEVLTRREILSDMVTEDYGDYFTFDRMGLDGAFDLTTLEMPFSFWMSFTNDDCTDVPPTQSSDQELFDFIDGVIGWISYADLIVEIYEPYVYQAVTQLGWPAIAWEHLQDVLVTGPNREDPTLPSGVSPEDLIYDPSCIQEIADWVRSSGEEMMFIYGETDPWTTGMFDIADATDSHIFVAPDGNHGSMLHSLTPADQTEALELLSLWLGVIPNVPLPPGPSKAGRDANLPPWLPPEGYPPLR